MANTHEATVLDADGYFVAGDMTFDRALDLVRAKVTSDNETYIVIDERTEERFLVTADADECCVSLKLTLMDDDGDTETEDDE